MKQALQALIDEMEYVLSCINEDKIPFDGDDFHAALRLGKEALAKQKHDELVCVCGAVWENGELVETPQPKQEQGEPVAWDLKDVTDAYKLGAKSQQRTWVGLDPEEIRKTNHHMVDGAYHYSFKQGAEWAEAKLKERNT